MAPDLRKSDEQLKRVPRTVLLPPRIVRASRGQHLAEQYREPRKRSLSLIVHVSTPLTTHISGEINSNQVPGSDQEPLVDRLLTCTVKVPLGTELPSKALPATIRKAKSESASGTGNTSQVSTETLELQAVKQETPNEAVKQETSNEAIKQETPNETVSSETIHEAVKSNDDMAIVQRIADDLVRRAREMSKGNLYDLAKNLLAQKKTWKEGPPKVAKYPVWDNPGVRRGAIIRMSVIQQAFGPNTKEDRHRFVVGTGWADAARRLVIVYYVSRTDMIVGVVTTRSGRGVIDLTDRDRGLWGALWENGNAKMKREDFGVTVNAQMLHGFRGNISKRSVFKLYGTPMILPANYMVEGYLTKESCDLLPLPDGYNNYGWIHGYETVTPQITLEPPEPYHDVDQPAPQEEVLLSYDGQMTDHSPQNSNVDSCEDSGEPRPSHSRKRDRSPGVGPIIKRLRRLSTRG